MSFPEASNSENVKVGNFILKLGETLKELKDSTHLYKTGLSTGDFSLLRNELETYGVIFIRGVLNKEKILESRKLILDRISTFNPFLQGTLPQEAKFNQTHKVGWTVYGVTGEVVGVPDSQVDEAVEEKWKRLMNEEILPKSYGSPELLTFYEAIFTKTDPFNTEKNRIPSPLPDCTWLRIRGQRELTAEHMDYYYFKEHTSIFDHYMTEESQTWREFHDEKSRIPDGTTCNVCLEPVDWDLQEEEVDFPPIPTVSDLQKWSHTFSRCKICHRCTHHTCFYLNEPDKGNPKMFPNLRGGYHCSRCANAPLNYWTVWMPLGSVKLKNGRLALVPGSHKTFNKGFQDSTSIVPSCLTGTEAGRTTLKTQIWYGADMEPGDFIMFNIKTLHAANENRSDTFRISIDTRVTLNPRVDA